MCQAIGLLIRRKLWLVGLSVLEAMSPGGHSRAQTGATTQQQLIQEYVEAFKPHGMVAVLIPIGQEVGDMLDKLGEEVIHRRSECFANLVPRTTPSRLPSLDLDGSAALRFGLGL